MFDKFIQQDIVPSNPSTQHWTYLGAVQRQNNIKQEEIKSDGCDNTYAKEIHQRITELTSVSNSLIKLPGI